MEQRRQLRVVQKIWETTDVVTLVLEPDGPLPLTYRPGQYIPLIFNTFGREKRRAYSFSSNPGVDARPAITVKRVPNGEFSNYLLHLEPGALLSAAEPAGQFVLPDPPPAQLVYLAAGSGITPVVSHLKALLESGRPAPEILLYYANRESQQTLFKDRLDRWKQRYAGRFSVLYFFSREKDAPDSYFGHLNNALFERLLLAHFGARLRARGQENTRFYLCAPTALMRMAAMTLRTLDVPEQAIIQENFVPETRLPQRTIDPARTHTVIARGRGQEVQFQVFDGETILNGALRQGIDLPYTCKSGVCFSCLARCVEGEVDVVFVHATRRQGRGQMVNTCIGYAVTDQVELRYE